MKWILWIFVALAGFLILIALIGWLLPKDHAATRQARYRQPPEAVWKAITDVDAMPSWREGLRSVKHLPDKNGLPAHLEVTTMGEIPMETVDMTPPRKLVGRIADPKLPFGGTWTFEITPTAEGSNLRITENGYVTNPVFRFLSRFVFGYTGTIESYLKSLAKKFGEPPRIEE
ncbi:MAG TPA: SRPBCC family protein [Candidatus Acidoferrum sp.]|nr:SRPBCC family protein [Candidatus Acidoferrum sp.]